VEQDYNFNYLESFISVKKMALI